MVDCITPATTGDDIGVLAVRTGLEDQGRARPEALSQWVTENRFAGPRPALEIAGAQ